LLINLAEQVGMSQQHITSIREFLAFKLGSEEYGIDILRVQEVRSYEEPTRMAHAPAFIKGVINLRGVIVPIIDLRMKFNLEQVSYDDATVVIMLNIGERVLGMVVDSVSDVMTLMPNQLRAVTGLTSVVGNEHLLALAVLDDRMLILLDVAALMHSAEMGMVVQSKR
jgi:purine-binding chemotaxis protein CheW